MRLDILQVDDTGLRCAAGDFTIDPWGVVQGANGVDVAIVTHAHADHARPGSRVVHCSRRGAAVTQARVGPDSQVVGHDWGERFELGRAVVSLHPAGHILGSAQVRVEVDGEVWVFSGDYKRDPDPTCAPFEVVPCDVFITEATFALPIYRWPEPDEVMEVIWDWWRQNRARGKTSMLFCYALGKAQRVLAALTRFGDEPVYVHGAVEPLTDAYREAGIEMLPTLRATDVERTDGFVGELILAPPSASRTPWMKRFRNVETAFASGWMRVRGVRRGRGWDRGFVLSDHVDWPGLVETVEATGAGRVLATHGRTDVIVRYLRERGLDASALHTPYGGEED